MRMKKKNEIRPKISKVMRNYVGIMSLLLLGTSCWDNRQTMESVLIDDKDIVAIEEQTLLSSILEVENVVPLETNDSSLLGNIKKVVKEGSDIYISSYTRPLMRFSEAGAFENSIGKVGIAPEEYVDVVDFDVHDGTIYLLSINKIQIYSKQGAFQKTIPVTVNASNIRVTDKALFLYCLGDEYVVHVLDKEGNEVKEVLERNQALRLVKAIPFVRYGDDCLLIPLGRSNDILAYRLDEDSLVNIKFLSSNALSIEKEKELIENNPNDRHLYGNEMIFDGLISSKDHIVFGSLKGRDITMWVKNIETGEVHAYKMAELVDDVTFTSAAKMFMGNIDSKDSFITYLSPNRLLQGLEKNKEFADLPRYKRLQTILEGMNVEEANPILIEYTYTK